MRHKKQILEPETTDMTPIIDQIEKEEFSSSLDKNYMRYTFRVILHRAIPDARDGLKPSQRRILVAMNDLNLHHTSATEKCAKICGDTSGNFHPHGESVIYPTICGLIQEWLKRHPLIEGQGNFGTPGGDPASAMRYTEARLSPFGDLMLADLSPDVVDFSTTYNEKRLEPNVLPAAFPNLLANGTIGIAVGIATKMPMHNLREIANSIEAYIKNPNITVAEIVKIMPGPDFPGGGILRGQAGVKSYYETGRGALEIDGVYTVEKNTRQNFIIRVTELPYDASPEKLSTQIEDLVKNKKIEGILDLKDLSQLDKNDKRQIELLVEVSKNANIDLVINQLLKSTCLRNKYDVNQTVLLGAKVIENTPIIQLIRIFVDHRKEVLTKKFSAELIKHNTRIHILDGLIRISEKIQETVKLITAANDPNEAIQSLISAKLVDTEEQAKAVLAITLRQLTKLESNNLINEKKKLNMRIDWLTTILGDVNKIMKLIIKEQQEIASKYGDDRRTQIGASAEDLIDEDLIKEETILVSITKDGYIKRLPLDTYKVQNRGGRGVIGMTNRETDEAESVFVISTHDDILFFTNNGLVFKKKGYLIPTGARTNKGTHLANLLSLNSDESVVKMSPISENDIKDHFVLMVTKAGLIKRSKLEDYGTTRKNKGIQAVKLNPEDELAFIDVTDGTRDIFIVTAMGKAIRYSESLVKVSGRVTAGAKAFAIKKEDEIVSVLTFDKDDNPDILVVTAYGYGKRTSAAMYRCANNKSTIRGVNTIDTVSKSRNGNIIGACPVANDDNVLLLTKQGKVIQIKVDDIRATGRSTMGVVLQKLDDKDMITSIVRIKAETDNKEI